jgi:hypothetical protein
MTFLTVPLAARRQPGPQMTSKPGLTNVRASGRSRVDGDDDAALEAEREGSGAVLDLDPAGRVRVVVRVQPQERRRLCVSASFP